jgi:Flp pilus assembly protein TadG
MRVLRAWLAALACDRAGGAALEMVLVMPLMLAVMAAIYDGARFVIQAQQVKIAVDAGADWARTRGSDPSAIAAAMIAATPAVLTSTSAQLHVRCNAGDVDRAAGYNCPGGGAAGNFVIMQAQSQYAPAVAWGALAARTIQGQAVVRVP